MTRSNKSKRRRTRNKALRPRQPQPTPAQVQIAAQQVLEQYSGPIPPPSMLREFNDVVPGSAERVLAAWEAQSQHRQTIEKQVIAGNIAAQKRGAWLGFLVCLAVIGVAAYIAKIGHPGVAGILVGGDVVGLVAVFVYGRVDQRREREDKYKLMYGR